MKYLISLSIVCLTTLCATSLNTSTITHDPCIKTPFLIYAIIDVEMTIHQYKKQDIKESIIALQRHIDQEQTKVVRRAEMALIANMKVAIDQIIPHFEKDLLESVHADLNILKSNSLMFLKSKNICYDHYIELLWEFQAEMTPAVATAKDPLLDKYEWNELHLMMDCMNAAWWPLIKDYPSAALLLNDSFRYRIQESYKIELDISLQKLNRAISIADGREESFCVAAQELEEAYYAYLQCFNPDYDVAKNYFFQL